MMKQFLKYSFLFSFLILSWTVNGQKIDFKWDFSQEGKKYVYSTQWNQNMNMVFDAESAERKMTTETNRELTVQVKDKHSADLILGEATSHYSEITEDGEEIGEIPQPKTVIQEFNEKSEFKYPNSLVQLDLLFLLPKQDLQLGDSTVIPLEFPSQLLHHQLITKGNAVLKFVRYDTLQDIEVAVFEADIKVADLDIPEGLDGEFVTEAMGQASYYFDLKNQYFVGSDLILDLNILVNRSKSNQNEEDLMGDIYMKMDSHDTIRIRLIEIKE